VLSKREQRSKERSESDQICLTLTERHQTLSATSLEAKCIEDPLTVAVLIVFDLLFATPSGTYA